MGGMQLRTVAFVGLLGVTLGWAAATRVQDRSPADPAQGRTSSGPRPLGTGPANVAPLTEQLRLKLEQKPRAPRAARNPFVFANRPAVDAARARTAPASTPPAESAPPDTPPEPPPSPGAQLRLTGMAATATSGGTEWTAMVHDGQSLLFVKLGDRLPGGFEVVDIQETAVTIRDSAGGERTLRLR
jgi:hypothetical protein